MSLPEPSTARAIAAFVLTQADPRKVEVTHILSDYLNRTDQPRRATDLVFGVMKNRSLIDGVIEKVSAVPVARISPEILNVIRVAIYELIYCPLTPEHAIVSQAVENAKAVAGRKQAGFVNAVLRQTTRHIEAHEKSLGDAPASRVIPQNMLTGCQFDLDLLDDPQQSPIYYLAGAFSLPQWLVEGWLKTYGPEKTRQICFACNRRPSIYLLPNILKTTVEELLEKLQGRGVQCKLVAEMDMIRLDSPGAISSLPGFDEGLFTVQDISAATVIKTLQPKFEWSILDLCAAPGTKTSQLAIATGGRAKIVATDIDGQRLKMVGQNISRLDISGSVVAVEYADLDEYIGRCGCFDCVLVDAPCSNTAVMARRPEVRYRLITRVVEALARTQLDLLLRAKELVKPGGIICYSTCSIQPDENNFVVRRFLADSDFEPGFEKLTLPSAEGFDHDGGYAAVVRRPGT